MITLKKPCIFMKTAILIALCIATVPVFGAIPGEINYQGYLTDSSGTPIDATVNIHFALYTVDTGGIAVWNETQSVVVTNGAFEVELGAVTAFGPGIFDTPLWLGLAVDTDPEMTPRKALTSVGYAFKADDADSVGGLTSTQLDQSAHAGSTSNPHSVTAAQLGALTGADLTWGNISNVPADLLDGDDVGILLETDPTVDPGVKDGVAWSEVTSKPAGFADNVDNDTVYTDGDAVAAIKAADGAGSTLDADLLDGLQANEIIDAAGDEVRIPITSLPYTVTTPGSYYLVGDLTAPADTTGITIDVDNVTVDLMGYSLVGNSTTTGHGIYSTKRNIEIRNGTVRGFYNGIYVFGFSGTAGEAARVLDMRVLDNVNYGVSVQAPQAEVRNTHVMNNGGDGISIGNGGRVINCSSAENRNGILVSEIAGPSDEGSTVTGNTLRNNTHHGIACLGDACRVTENTVYGSGGNGVWIGSGGLAEDNVVRRNNTTSTANYAGILSNGLVRNNVATTNGVNNILAGSSAVIEYNLVSGSTNGIAFNGSGIFYANNRASGNTTNYNNLGSWPPTDGGGNVSF